MKSNEPDDWLNIGTAHQNNQSLQQQHRLCNKKDEATLGNDW